MKLVQRTTWLLMVGMMSLILLAPASTSAEHNQQFDDPVSQGEYLARIAGCVSCHTPPRPEFEDEDDLTTEQLKTLAFTAADTLEPTLFMAGGTVFNLGPAGTVYAANITPDQETGLGDWTNEEIKAAIRTGARPDGRVLHRLMPYSRYNGMAEADLDALVLYLRSLPPIVNEVPEQQISTTDQEPLEPVEDVVAPAPGDTAARGEYLLTYVANCSRCHTPTDPETRQSLSELAFAGGRVFEGPWGIVYGGNITPHDATGIGTWEDEDISRVLRQGLRPDGRRLMFMPWQDFADLTDEDMAAVIHFLRNDIEPIENEVPPAAVEPTFLEYVELDNTPAENEAGTVNTLLFVVGGTVLIILLLLAVAFTRQRQAKGKA